MGKEIRKETDWLGREKEVIYEDGQKTGEIRSETTFRSEPEQIAENTGRLPWVRKYAKKRTGSAGKRKLSMKTDKRPVRSGVKRLSDRNLSKLPKTLDDCHG